MSLSDTFIRRPVLSTVCSILILMAGLICLPLLPIENLPNIAPPTVQVSANLPGADALTVINTCQGMAVDWRRRKPLLGNVVGGLSGPAIKPIALRCVHQVRQAVDIPIVGVGGIMTIDDCMEFFVTGASALQIGTANFAEPIVSARLLDGLPAALAELGAAGMADVIGTLAVPQRAACPPATHPSESSDHAI
jgi:dihydroorotate dehydrogenase (NAD+) catalytic subunit